MSATRRDYLAISAAIRSDVDMLRHAQSRGLIQALNAGDMRTSDHLAGGLEALYRASLSIGAHFYDANPRGFDLQRFMADSGFAQ